MTTTRLCFTGLLLLFLGACEPTADETMEAATDPGLASTYSGLLPSVPWRSFGSEGMGARSTWR